MISEFIIETHVKYVCSNEYNHWWPLVKTYIRCLPLRVEYTRHVWWRKGCSTCLWLSFLSMCKTEWKNDCCYEKKRKVKGNSLEETILTSLSVAACMWGAHPTSAVVRRAQSRQPATSASLPTNRHARLRLCAVLSVSAAEAGRRGTATAAPSIFPGMRLSVATPLSVFFFFFFLFAMLWHSCCMLSPSPPTLADF